MRLCPAAQLWDDKSLANIDFPYIWRKAMPSTSHSKIRLVLLLHPRRRGAFCAPQLTNLSLPLTRSLSRVNYMERKFLELLQYNVNVKARCVPAGFSFTLPHGRASLSMLC